MSTDDTTRIVRNGGLSAEDRLERIENAVEKMSEKLDIINKGLSDGSTRFATIDLTIQSLTHRIDRLENARDAVIKLVMGAVALAVLAMIGLKAVG